MCSTEKAWQQKHSPPKLAVSVTEWSKFSQRDSCHFVSDTEAVHLFLLVPSVLSSPRRTPGQDECGCGKRGTLSLGNPSLCPVADLWLCWRPELQGVSLAYICGKMVQNRLPVLLLAKYTKQASLWELVPSTPHTAHHPGLSSQSMVPIPVSLGSFLLPLPIPSLTSLRGDPVTPTLGPS